MGDEVRTRDAAAEPYVHTSWPIGVRVDVSDIGAVLEDLDDDPLGMPGVIPGSLPPQVPSAGALEFYRRWLARWDGYHPRDGYGAPERAFDDHRHAHPEFRNPLSSADGVEASSEFHAGVVARLAGAEPITVLTFDRGGEGSGEQWHQTSDLGGLFEREFAWSMVESAEEWELDPGDEGEQLTLHVFMTQIGADDPRLGEVWRTTAVAAERLLVVGPDLRWLARPRAECVAVASYDATDIETLREVQRETWTRWGVPAERFAHVDLARVAAYIDERRSTWAARGVRIVTEPQYRTWHDEDVPDILDELPADLSLTDWVLVGLASDTAEATLTVHDSGATSMQLDPDVHDEDADTVFEYRDRAGTLDLDGVVAVFERVVATLSPDAMTP